MFSREIPRSKGTVAARNVEWLSSDFKTYGITGSRDHSCMDCSYKVGENQVTSLVIDGATATACVCAAKGCGILGGNCKRRKRRIDVPHRNDHCEAIVDQPGPARV